MGCSASKVSPHQRQPPKQSKQQQQAAREAKIKAREEKMAQWVNAKRAKDYQTADRLREELRAIGVDPDTARPPNGGGPQPQAKRFRR